MIARLDVPVLIAVPNITLQEQWREKCISLFLDDTEHPETLISTSLLDIKKINIITYQSLTGSSDESDVVKNRIYTMWYEDEWSETQKKEDFIDLITGIHESDPEEYREKYGSYAKKLKKEIDTSMIHELLKDELKIWIEKMKTCWIGAIILDEAHHLTSWWSRALYEIIGQLGNPITIGLTATPPFENADYFELDENYTNLLWEVDYYVPTPAIVRSGRLAPYSDLIQIVSPDNTIQWELDATEKQLQNILDKYWSNISLSLHEHIVTNYDTLKNRSMILIEKWTRFILRYKPETAEFDMRIYLTESAKQELSLEDIAKSLWFWIYTSKNTITKKEQEDIRKIFFNLGYINRQKNFYRFQTPMEKSLIYSMTKIQGIQTILNQEEKNLKSGLKCAIIVDFLDKNESKWISGKDIIESCIEKYNHLNPYLVSGQWIWKIENSEIQEVQDESILSITEKLRNGSIQLIIGTRGILGEWWDCPELNTLIDVTGVSAYMSVNQIHGRAIRKDLKNPNKVANIYDIVCIGHGLQWLRDFERLSKKHNQFYWVDDMGSIVKELDHVYPQLEKHIQDRNMINTYMLRKSALRSMIYELWGIGKEYSNTETFSLSIEVRNPYSQYYIPTDVSRNDLFDLLKESTTNDSNILELGKSTYHRLLRKWLKEIIDATLIVLMIEKEIPSDFTYELQWSTNWSIKIKGDYPDQIVSKKVIEIIGNIFSSATDENYIIEFDTTNRIKNYGGDFNGNMLIPVIIGLSFGFLWVTNNIVLVVGLWIVLFWIIWIIYVWRQNQIWKKAKKDYENNYISNPKIQLPIPKLIGRNESRRNRFIEGGVKLNASEIIRYFFPCLGTYIGKIKNAYIFQSIVYIFILSLFLCVLNDIYFDNSTLLLTAVWGLWIVICGSFILYLPLAMIYSIKFTTKRLTAIIRPVTPLDIGKTGNLTAKIEKIWI
jgi:superfamily II DNA or RNA helicase